MGAMLKVLALTTDLTKHEYIVDPMEIDIISCDFNEVKDGDVKEGGLKGRVVIDTMSSNRISIGTGTDGKVLSILVNPKFENPYSIKGVKGALILYTAYKMHFDDEEKFAQYVLGKGGKLPEPIGNMD